MSERAARLLGTAILAAGGGVMMGLGGIAKALKGQHGEAGDVGAFVLLIAGMMFLVDWARSFRTEWERLPEE